MLKRNLWAWPILTALFLGALGWWVNRTVEAKAREQLAARLITIRNADVTALKVWLKQQEGTARIIAAMEPVKRFAGELLKTAESPNRETALLQSNAAAELRTYLIPRLQIYNYAGFFVVTRSGGVAAADQDAAVGKVLNGYQAEFFKGIAGTGQASVSIPFRSIVLLADARGELKAGLPTMFAAAPLTDDNGVPIGALGLRIRPELDLTEILSVAQSGETGETYAFDENGLFLSSSRFDDDLKRIGLLADLPDSQSVLTLELRDPQVDMTSGERPALRRHEQPLTRMALDAITGSTGVEVTGYRDYRGVPSVAAWTWIPEYGFGVATRIDVAEAYRQLYVLRMVFWTLFGVSLAASVLMFAFMTIAERHRIETQRAVIEARKLGQYSLEEKLGSGGMGTVYRAKHALLRRSTAVKLLNIDKISDTAIARFEREVQLTSQLNHPNTIAIYDFGRTPEGIFFYAMEFLDGIDLEDLIFRYGAQPEGRVISILQQMCGSLAEAHGIGLIHRDIKPANIILNRRGGQYDVVKVLDFGLVKSLKDDDSEARLTAAGSLAGTPLYLSPEAIERPDSADARSDIYAIGAVGYYLLTGTPVFKGSTIVEICLHHVQTPPETPSQRLGRPVSAQLESVILKCLAKKPQDRPQTASELADELAGCEASAGWSREDAQAWWMNLETQRMKRAAAQSVTDDREDTVLLSQTP
ncbi:MAG TPA: serine/threonine protein kinase [Blastocatellia bacterium]|nr:serine/threonine protein kinase [Blastocatellia bacterium]